MKLLKNLNLAYNRLGDKGISAIFSENWEKLIEINIESNNVKLDGLLSILISKCINLEILNLSMNRFDNLLTKQIKVNESMSFKKLNLSSCYLNQELIKNILISQKSLLEINLKLNDISAELHLLVEFIPKSIQILNLQSNSIDTRLAKIISDNTSWLDLRILNLSYNSIKDEGFEYLSKNKYWVSLEKIDVRFNKLTNISKNFLKNSFWPKLKKIEFEEYGNLLNNEDKI